VPSCFGALRPLVAGFVLSGLAFDRAPAGSLQACAVRDDVACEASRAAVVPSGALLALQRDNLKQLTAIRRETRRRLLAGEASSTDMAEVEARLAAARSSLYAAQAQYAAAKARYLAIIGASPAEVARTRTHARANRR